MLIDYSNVTVSHAIENNLHKQQCIIGLAGTHKYNTLCKIYIILYVCLQALINVGYMHTPYKLFECSWTRSKRFTFPSKRTPQQNFMATGLMWHALKVCTI